MRVLLGLLLLTALGYTTLNAQPFHGGIMIGFTASQVDGDSYAGYNKLGLLGGAFISTSLTRLFDARLEIRYAARGAVNPASKDNTGFYKLGLHYIDLPLLASVRIKQIGAIELGLVPGYLFAAQGRDDDGKLPGDYLVSFRKFDLGTLVGVKINITPKITLNFRYSYSIFSIRDLESAGAYYSWFGKLFGHSRGDFNNYLTSGINYLLK
jgi:hypothetical protein